MDDELPVREFSLSEWRKSLHRLADWMTRGNRNPEPSRPTDPARTETPIRTELPSRQPPRPR